MPASLSNPLDFLPTLPMLEAALAELEELGGASGSAVEPRSRRAAFDAYRRLARTAEKYPPRRRHDYASLRLADLTWLTGRVRMPASARTTRISTPAAADVSALAIDNAGGLVHLGSVYLEPAVRLGDPRVSLLPLADARRTLPAVVASVMGRIVPADSDRFTALATAFQNCGAYIDVPAGVALEAPLQIVWTARPGPASVIFPHAVIRIGAGARATVVERHVGESESFHSGIVEIEVAAGARLDYVVVQQADDGARAIVRRGARCAAGASIGWHVAELGAALARSTIVTQLAGTEASVDLNALFFARGFAHVDFTIDMRHDACGTTSNAIVRSAATDRGQGRFTGGIAIPARAQGCRAAMRDDALVLSRDAYIEATPALEIDANDVAASHAATVGSLDEEQLFYVQSRGFARGSAERMLALAFFEPALARFPTEILRDEIRTALDERLDEIPDTFVS